MRTKPARPLISQMQKGPRAYIVFSMGRAIAVTDMAKEADVIIRGLKSRRQEASKWRRSSRTAAEEYAAWHNYQLDQANALVMAGAEERRQRRISTKG